jgi:hypothetical protein
MKKILLGLAISTMMVSCTKDLGSLQSVSTKEFKTNQNYELALKRQSYTAKSLEECVDKALKSVPNSAFLKNTQVTSKLNKVTIVTDIWTAAKKPKEKADKTKYKKPKGQSSKNRVNASNAKDLKIGMRVSWDHPKAGKGNGMIVKIAEGMAQVDKVINSDGKPGKPLRLPLEVLKPMKKK